VSSQMIPARNLIERVVEHIGEHPEAVSHPTR
jgi:hypothetical protein